MSILTPAEKTFLDVFLHEATTEPFNGPATQALHSIGVEYNDITYLAWAYDQEVPRTSIEWGRVSDASPPLAWPTRQDVLFRNAVVQNLWEQQHQVALTSPS
jgi:hypothetical protein